MWRSVPIRDLFGTSLRHVQWFLSTLRCNSVRFAAIGLPSPASVDGVAGGSTDGHDHQLLGLTLAFLSDAR